MTLKSLKVEIDQRKPMELFGLLKNLNTFENARQFKRDGIDIQELLRYGAAQLLKRKLRLPVHGYFDLVKLIEEGHK